MPLPFNPDFKQNHGDKNATFLLFSAVMLTDTIPDTPQLRGPVALAHLVISRFLRRGDRAVDATCGNGHDTLLLAKLVGDTGRVWAFDIQERAISQTSLRLAQAGLLERVELILGGHETMSRHAGGDLGVVVFNLGYLPGGDQTIITRPDTTLAALGHASNLLRPGGVLAITIYPGHEGGGDEQRAVDDWASALTPKMFHSWRMGQLNVPIDAPYFILVQKAA